MAREDGREVLGGLRPGCRHPGSHLLEARAAAGGRGTAERHQPRVQVVVRVADDRRVTFERFGALRRLLDDPDPPTTDVGGDVCVAAGPTGEARAVEQVLQAGRLQDMP